MTIKTLVRLNSSPYQRIEFFEEEKLLAQKWNLQYLYWDSQNERLPGQLPLPYKGEYILISNTHTLPELLPEEVLAETKLWIHSNSGYDNFSVPWLKAQKFPVITGNPIRRDAVVEYILGCLISHFSLASHQKSWEKQRTWDRELLSQKNILIIGKGLIGQKLGQALKPIGKKVSYYDPFKGNNEDLIELASGHSVVLLAASLNPTSEKIVNKTFLEALPSNFLLINASRGALINQEALIDMLMQRPNAFAYLDVFEREPFGNEFEGLKNIHCTSHIAGVSKNLSQDMLKFEDEVLSAFFLNSPEDFLEEYKELNLINRCDKDYLI